MQDNDRPEITLNPKDAAWDILSHPMRGNRVHILTLDNILAADIYERIHYDPRMKYYELVRPQKAGVKETVIEIDGMALDTVGSKLLILDVRRDTLPMLQRSYNKVVGYNRRDLNRLCYSILIGDGPVNLFQAGKSLDVFISHLSSHRVDYHPAVFFYDPFLHYEADEIQHRRLDDEFVLRDRLPKRLVRYFKKGEDVGVDSIRRFFRATGKPEQVVKDRLKILRDMYERRIAEQFPHHEDQLKAWLSKEGIRLATEKLHLYPLFFEDWVYDLMQKAGKS
ncbi:MAG TPA: hypothetical protein VMX13_13780 [Sedimentisphaerales bacterium]|nr:hypothetical protein [Sedimentisphaerales bacterium]